MQPWEEMDWKTKSALMCMFVTNPGDGPRPVDWRKRVNDFIREQTAEIERLNAALKEKA